jgi:hypothetical protein
VDALRIGQDSPLAGQPQKMDVGSAAISARSGSTNDVAPVRWYRCQAELRSRQKSVQADAVGLNLSRAIGKRVHSGPISGVQGAALNDGDGATTDLNLDPNLMT